MYNPKNYFVYIITNFENTTLYVGVTNSLIRRIQEHKNGKIKGFSAKYKLTKLVYYEIYGDIYAAINREKQIKAGSRKKKEDLIKNINPEWFDLFKKIY